MFVARFEGSLHDLCNSIGEYRQLQYLQITSSEEAILILIRHFLGEHVHDITIVRIEFHKMKCCSMLPRDLEKALLAYV